MKLPDLNVWLAAAWRNHAYHDRAKRWFDEEPGGMGFCRVTQMGFLRLVTNPAITEGDALTRRGAWRAYSLFLSDERVSWLSEPEDIEVQWRAFSDRSDRSHRLWTDDYLAAFALRKPCVLVTFDKGCNRRYPGLEVELLEV